MFQQRGERITYYMVNCAAGDNLDKLFFGSLFLNLQNWHPTNCSKRLLTVTSSEIGATTYSRTSLVAWMFSFQKTGFKGQIPL